MSYAIQEFQWQEMRRMMEDVSHAIQDIWKEQNETNVETPKSNCISLDIPKGCLQDEDTISVYGDFDGLFLESNLSSCEPLVDQDAPPVYDEYTKGGVLIVKNKQPTLELLRVE